MYSWILQQKLHNKIISASNISFSKLSNNKVYSNASASITFLKILTENDEAQNKRFFVLFMTFSQRWIIFLVSFNPFRELLCGAIIWTISFFLSFFVQYCNVFMLDQTLDTKCLSNIFLSFYLIAEYYIVLEQTPNQSFGFPTDRWI